jgi:hypothetical protein
MNDKFTMTTGQAHEFALSCRRNGLDPAAVKFLSQGTNIRTALQLLGWTAAVAATFLTSTYWTTDPSRKLWVSLEFTQRITPAYPDPIPHRGLEGVTHFQSKSSDAKNIAEMGGEAEVRKHAFTPDQLADLRDKQVNGKDGDLLTNGCWNLFYVIGKDGVLFVVGLYWFREVGRWDASAWHFGDDVNCFSDNRVFRNTLELEA